MRFAVALIEFTGIEATCPSSLLDHCALRDDW